MSINASRNNPLRIGDVGWRPTEVHPLAAVFPMLTSDELAELADDIKANGLLHPIMIDDTGVLIDGRNRLAACEIAGVEPTWEHLHDGIDPAAVIVSANLARRNLTKGQQAVALAMIYPEPRRGRGNKDEALKVLETRDFSRQRLEQARSVLKHSRALAEDVLSKRTSLDKALATVEEERRAGQSMDAKMTELRAKAPDIADLVDDERISLDVGMTELRTRQRRDEEAVDAARQAVRRLADIPVQLAMIQKGVAVAGFAMLDDLNLIAIAEAIGALQAMAKEASQ
jgi:ParB-like chromosome segregation protein Spo0J